MSYRDCLGSCILFRFNYIHVLFHRECLPVERLQRGVRSRFLPAAMIKLARARARNYTTARTSDKVSLKRNEWSWWPYRLRLFQGPLMRKSARFIASINSLLATTSFNRAPSNYPLRSFFPRHSRKRAFVLVFGERRVSEDSRLELAFEFPRSPRRRLYVAD